MNHKDNAENSIQLLIKFAARVSSEPHLDALLEIIADQVREILNGDRCTVFLIDYETNELWSKVAHGMEHQEIRVPIGKGIAGQVASTGQAINIEDAYKDSRFTVDIDRVTGYHTKSMLAYPLKNNKGEMLGVFQILNKRDGSRFSETDEGLLLLLSSVASNAVENAQLYESVKKAQLETTYRLAVTAEYRDQEDTAKHLRNISILSYTIAKTMGLPKEAAENLRHASPLHDIGKVGVPDAILLKPGKLTDEEYSEMKKHAIYGGKILDNAKSELLRIAHKVAICHHEKYDGSGYPNGLKGEEIPIEARIVAVADVFDALCMPRVYKAQWPPDKAYEYIVSQAGKSFDPDVVKAFQESFPAIKELYS